MSYKDPNDERACESRRKHYRNNRQQYYDRNAQAKRQKRQLILDAKDKPCMDCGQRFGYWVMQFDHRPGTVKMFNLSVGANKTYKQIEQELNKCDVVCSNCHANRTHSRLTMTRSSIGRAFGC